MVHTSKIPNKFSDSISLSKKNRILYLFGEICTESAQEIIKDLIELDLSKKKSPITIFLNSPGGECDAGFAIMDTILNLRNTVKMMAVGDICSMAPAIYVAAKERYIAKHSYVMFHPIHTYHSDYVQFVKSRLKNVEEAEKMYDNFIFSRTKLPKKLYKKAKVGELWLTADESIRYGIAHKIL